MLPSLILQLMIDVLLVSVVAWLWLQQKKSGPLKAAAVSPAPSLETEKTILELKSLLEVERRKIQTLHDRIQKLIEQGALTATIFPMSDEEEELKSLAVPPRNQETIPTLKQFEITQERINQETNVDLKTILRDQLA